MSLVCNNVLTLAFFNRFFPLVYLQAAFLAAYALSESLAAFRFNWLKWMVPLALAAAAIFYLYSSVAIAPGWSLWNYGGIQDKAGFAQWEQLGGVLASLPPDGRVSMELLRGTPWYDNLGGPFVPEITPMMTGKPTDSTGSHGLYSLSFKIVNVYINQLAYRDANQFYPQAQALGVGYIVKLDSTPVTGLD